MSLGLPVLLAAAMANNSLPTSPSTNKTLSLLLRTLHLTLPKGQVDLLATARSSSEVRGYLRKRIIYPEGEGTSYGFGMNICRRQHGGEQ